MQSLDKAKELLGQHDQQNIHVSHQETFYEFIYDLYLSHPSEMAGSYTAGRLNTIQNNVSSQT